MTSTIALLDEQTINKIAAGEVIESPASVVKELVENALDAKATHITVQVQGGGFDQISVQDNGVGMHADDLPLAILRYATSKIRKVEDVFSLHTMGFRGEALSSIAAVSELSIITAPRKESLTALQEGFFFLAQGGVQKESKKTSCFSGTTIDVKKLFHNVPARRKFQKSPDREGAEIIKVMTHIVLACPEIAFDLVVNGKKEFSLKNCSFQERVEAVFGKKEQMKHLHFEMGEFRFEGCISSPENTRTNRTQQYLFINKRPVQSLAISYAVKDGYGAAIEKTRHPIFALHLHLPPHLVDVNVHPQKKEVRFQREDEIKKALSQAVQDTLFPKVQKKAQLFIQKEAFYKQEPQILSEMEIPKPQVVQYVAPQPEIQLELPVEKKSI